MLDPASYDLQNTPQGVQDSYIQPKKNTLLKSHGRPPWYGVDGNRTCDAFVIGVAGGSASGKTHVARQIVQSLGSIPAVVILSLDSFYKCHTPEEIELANASQFDFDHPDALDIPLFTSCLADLKACKQTSIPVYSFSEHQRLNERKYLYGAAIIIAEGIMALQDPSLRQLYDLKIFVHCDSDLMLARRIQRDVKERGRSVDGVLEQYLQYVKPAYDHFVGPTARHADIIVPGSDNSIAIQLLTTHIHRQLNERSNQVRQQMAMPRSPGLSEPQGRLEDLDLLVLPQTPQLKGMITIIRNVRSTRQDLIFFVDRLATLLVEKALEVLPYRSKSVMTPLGVEYHGKDLDASFICGVSILRSGGALERGFRRVINHVPLGSVLIQSDPENAEPLLLHVMLPVCVRERDAAQETWVFLLDSQIGTGAAAFMAIRVLLDHGVKQDHIVFVTFVVARGGGISILRRAFPAVKIICAVVDESMREGWVEGEGARNNGGEVRKVWAMLPGIGQMGDRYYL